MAQNDVLDQAINNLRKMISGEEAQREPAGRMDDSVTKDVESIKFPEVPAQQLRQQQMDESLRQIKSQEQNKEMREEFPQYKFSSEKRMPAASAIGPQTKEAQSKFFTPSQPSLKPAIENLQKGLQAVKEETNTAEEQKKLKEKSDTLAQQTMDILNAPSSGNAQADAVLKLATMRSIKSIEDQQKRMQELVDKSGKPLFDEGDTAKVAILALAPIVAGYLVDGARGGAIGAQAGQIGISKFEEQKKEQLDRALKGLEKGAKITTSMLYNDSKLAETAARLNSSEKNAENIRLQSTVKLNGERLRFIGDQIKRLDDLKKQGLVIGQKYEVERAKLLNDQAKIITDVDKTRLAISKLGVSVEKQEKEMGSPDLGFGFTMKPTASKKDREQAQKLVAAYGDVEPAMRGLIDSVKTSNLKSLTSWSQAGEDLQRKATMVKDAIIQYSKRGASLTQNEEKLVNDMGISLQGEGSIRNKFKIAYSPDQLATQLETVLSGLKQRTAGKATPYGATLTEQKQVSAPTPSATRVIELSKNPAQAAKEFNALPSGTLFIDPTGKRRRKP